MKKLLGDAELEEAGGTCKKGENSDWKHLEQQGRSGLGAKKSRVVSS